MKSRPKRICLISVEIFAWGKHGGFGKATRTIGGELVKRGYEVFAITPQREGQRKEEDLDGITVLAYTQGDILKSKELYRKVKADVYHSCEPSFGTYLAKTNVPDAVHMSTIRDPRNTYDWWIDWVYPSKSRWQVTKNYLYENNFLVRRAVRNSDGVYAPAVDQLDKIRRMYHPRNELAFLPTPVIVPAEVHKSAIPNIVSMSRVDKRKRPELILSLAEKFPEVQFHIAGKSRREEYYTALQQQFNAPNIIYHGFVDQFNGTKHHDLLEQAWLLINTAAREALPNSFLEAAAHQCAILSFVNTDEFASNFGFHAAKDNFEEGLRYLLENDRWRTQGMKAYDHVRKTFALDVAMDRHEEVYERLFRSRS